MTISEILQSLRDCDYAECKEWADALEAAMREPVAYQDTWDTGLFSLPGDVREADRSGMVPLFRLPPDAAGEISPDWNKLEACRESLREHMAETERLRDLADTLRQQAQIHAQEARTANASLHECYRAATGGKGEPGNWNGANPVITEIERLKEEIEIAECLQDSQYLAGVTAGWNAANSDSPNEAKARIYKMREGRLKPLFEIREKRRARAALAGKEGNHE